MRDDLRHSADGLGDFLMDEDLRVYLMKTYEAQNAEAAERLKFSISLAQSGLQALTLINGGALVALFTLVGSATGLKFDLSSLWWAFSMFATGLVLNVLAFLGAHLSQDRYYEMAQCLAWDAQDALTGLTSSRDPMQSHRLGLLAQRCAIIAAILSLAAFITGSGFALSAVAH